MHSGSTDNDGVDSRNFGNLSMLFPGESLYKQGK